MICHKALKLAALVLLIGFRHSAMADSNAITSVSANHQGTNTIITIHLKNLIRALPVDFTIIKSAQITLDFPGVGNATGETVQDVSLGDVRNLIVAQNDDRARLVINLTRSLNYALVIDGLAVIMTIRD